jgi:hypothetical protein
MRNASPAVKIQGHKTVVRSQNIRLPHLLQSSPSEPRAGRNSEPKVVRTLDNSCLRSSLRSLFLGLLLMGMSVSAVSAVDLGMRGLTNPFSPLVFPPCFQGEAKVAPIWMFVGSGSLNTVGQGELNLRDDFGLTGGRLFLDAMIRLQAGAFSLRVYYEPRAFTIDSHVQNNPQLTGRTEFEYSGVRIGGDLDLVRKRTSRVGIDMDYQFYRPVFTQTIRPQAAAQVIGDNPLTMGAHAVYNPITNLWGISGIFEIRGRWSVSGASIADMDASIGVKSPETVLGSVALKSGYRRTAIEFNDNQNNFETVLSGWFGELAYYY